MSPLKVFSPLFSTMPLPSLSLREELNLRDYGEEGHRVSVARLTLSLIIEARVRKLGIPREVYHRIFLSFSWDIFHLVMRLERPRTSKHFDGLYFSYIYHAQPHPMILRYSDPSKFVRHYIPWRVFIFFISGSGFSLVGVSLPTMLCHPFLKICYSSHIFQQLCLKESARNLSKVQLENLRIIINWNGFWFLVWRNCHQEYSISTHYSF